MAKLIKLEKVETYLGTTYRFYVRGIYMGAAATRGEGARGCQGGAGELAKLHVRFGPKSDMET